MMTRKVSKTSVKASLFKFRRFVFALAFLFAAWGAWGETYTWTGAVDDDLTNPNNWNPNGIPYNNTDSVIIPSGVTFPSVTSDMFNAINIDSVKIEGELNITGNFTLAKIDAASSGTLKINGTLTHDSSQFNNAANLAFECTSLNISANLECKSMSVTSTSTLTHSGDITYLVATDGAGISFGDTVTVNGTGSQFILGGNINGSTTINVTSGLLNHVKENTNNHKGWSNNLIVNLTASGCSFGMQEEQSYKINVANTVTSGDIYLLGSGNISSLTDSSSNCTIHFGNEYDSGNTTNSFTFEKPVTFNGTKIVLGENCGGLNGSKKLSGIKSIDNKSVKENVQLDVNVELADEAEIKGSSLIIADLTCTGSTTFNSVNTIKNLIATNLGDETLTVNAAQTIQNDISLSGSDSSNKLTLAGSGSFVLSNVLEAQYLNFAATAPGATAGKAYASNSTGTATGWVVVDGTQHVWNGGNGAWETDTNWLPPGKPESTDDVIINSGNPVISTVETVNSIVINGGKVTVNSEKSLSLALDSELDTETKIEGEGSLILAAGKAYTIPDGKTFNINIVNNGTLSSSYSTVFSKSFTNAGAASFTNGISVAGKFKDTGSSFGGIITLNGSTDQIFEGKSDATEYNVVINKADGTVKFSKPLTLHSLDTNTNSYNGEIIFSGTGNQTLTPQSAAYPKTTISKESGTFIITGDASFSQAIDFGSAQVSVTGGTAGVTPDYISITAPSIKAGTIVCTDNDASCLELHATGTDGINITGNIGTSNSLKYNTVKLNAGINNITVGGNIYTSNIDVSCNEVTFDNAIYVGSVTIGATIVSINGMEADALNISGTNIKMGGTIKLTSDTQNFVIDYPLTLIDDTQLEITKKIIISGSGSIDSENDTTARALSLTAGGGIEIQDDTSLGASHPLSTITINSKLDIQGAAKFYTNGTDGTIFALTGNTLSSADDSGSLALNGNITNSGNWTFNRDISVTGNVTNSGTWNPAAGTGKLTFNGSGTTQTFTTNNGTAYNKIEVAENAKMSLVGNLTSTGNQIYNGELTIGGSSTLSSSGTIRFNHDVAGTGTLTVASAVTVADGKTVYPNVIISAGSITCVGAATFNGTVTNNGTLTVSSGITTFKADVNLSGTFTHSNGTVVLAPTASTISITGEPVFYDLKAENLGGKTITFDSGNTTINNKLTLKGSSGSKLIINGSGGTIYAATHEIENVNVSNSTAAAAKPLTALSSIDSGSNVNWNFLGFDYNWIAAAVDSDWNNRANWSPASIPGLGTKITINPTTAPDNYPKLSTITTSDTLDLSGGTYTAEITVEEGATFDIADKSLILGTSTPISSLGKITNNGTIIIHGVSGQAISNAEMKNGTNGDKGTVEYYSADFETFAWDGSSAAGKQYNNLVISEAITQPDGEVLDVAGYTKILSGATVTLDNSSNVFTGNVQIGTSSSSKPGTVTLNGTGASSAAIFLDENIYADSLVLNSKIQGAKLNVYASLIINANGIKSTDDQTYNETVTLGTDITFDTAANKTITFLNNIQGTSGTEILTANKNLVIGSSSETISVGVEVQTEKDFTNNANITLAKDITATGNVTDSGTWTQTTGTLIFTGTGEQTFTPKGTGTTYNSILINKAGGSFSTITNALSADSFTDHTGSSNSACTITFNKDVTIKSDVELTTTGEVTFATGNTYTFKDDSGNYKDFKNVTASTKLNGNVYANDITLAGTTITNLNIQKAADVTFGGTVSDGTLTITEAANTTFNESTTITNFSDTANAGNITFTNTSPNTAQIETAANFTTNGTVTFNGTFLAPSLSVANEASVTGTVRTDTTQIYTGNITGGTMILEGTSVTLHESLTPTGTVTFGKTGSNTNVFIDNSSTADFGESTGNTTSVKIYGNLIIHSGTITANTDVSATKDIIVLGNDYSDTDNVADTKATNIAKEFAYNCPRPDGWSQPQYTDTLPASHSAKLKVKASKTISAGINFYANGTTLSEAGGSGEWTLKIPDVRYSNTTNKTLGFAEAYFSDISGCKVVCSAGNTTEDTDGTKALLITLRCNDNGTNTNVDFGDFIIEEAYTVRDNAIYVRFNRPVRYHSGTITNLKFQKIGTTIPNLSFEGLYSTPDCREQDKLEYDTELSYFYIKATPQDGSALGAWNTDATGISTGASDNKSTDRSGVHHTTMPCLDFPRALADGSGNVSVAFILTDRWGKRLNNYSHRVTKGNAAEPAYGSQASSYAVLDKTGPVLYSVRTGQELHQELHVGNSPDPANDEHAYDSHNFIEFRYSEQVDFVGSDNDADLNDLTVSENIQVTDSLGAVLGDITQAGNLEIAGLGKIQNGKIHTGRNGSTDRYVNALYRLDDYSIRLSIAGYVDGTVTDSLSNEYKNWVGYIEDAVQVSGTVTLLVDTTGNIGGASGRVKDRAATPNWQIKYENNASNFIPNVNRSTSGVYGDWDISEPVFAIIRQNNRKVWEQALFTENYQSEAIGNPMGGTTLDRIEFHLFDNTPFDNIPAFENITDDPEWFTEVGWGKHDSSGTKDPDELYFYNSDTDGSFAADIFGGARPFANGTTSADNAAYRTSGGIRYSSLISSAQGFKYGIGSASPTTAFDEATPVYSGATSLIFAGASTPRRGADDLEGLYFGLPLADRSLDVKTSFTVKYDDTKAYITDLAGNRLRSKTITTIDRTPPSIDMTISPIGADEVEIIFVKELITNSSKIHYILNDTTEDYPISEPFEYLISQCLDIITIDDTGTPAVASDLAFDTAAPAKVWVTSNSTNSSFTHIKLKLSRAITLEDIETKFIRITHAPNYAEESRDLFTQQNGSRVTFIQDENGNTIQMYTAHALSDFAVSAVSPLYAYDSALTWDDGTIISENLWYTNTTDEVDPESWAVHDWNRDQKNFGTLPAGHTVAVVADSVSPNINIYVTNHPDEESDSGQANKAFEFEIPWRIWIPDVTSDVFRALAEKNNTEYSVATGTLLDGQSNRLIFDLDSQIVSKWSGGDQVTFLFGLMKEDGTPVTIMHSPELNINQDKHYLTSSIKMPLYVLRQTDPEDFMSLDLWSFRLKDIVNQRGGVTILNNVINSVDGEKVVVKVNQPQAGNLNVLVMTLDGNIVDYLHRGASEAGEHYYSWNGSNRKGNPVARGMYFIRVTGPGIDETRKVLVVK